jgi:hypothetical protein
MVLALSRRPERLKAAMAMIGLFGGEPDARFPKELLSVFEEALRERHG